VPQPVFERRTARIQAENISASGKLLIKMMMNGEQENILHGTA
jgi:hypothetical protein